MNGTKLFFAACIGFSMVVSGLIVFGALFVPDDVPPSLAAGFELWRDNGCAGCHTMYGLGGSYAPDLTHIASQRGEDYLREFLVNPEAFHPGERLMPRFGLTHDETTNLLGFLVWIESQEAASTFPPRPILVRGTGGLAGGVTVSQAQDDTAQEDPAVARGRAMFTQRCAACHSLTPEQAGLPGPSMYGIADRAWYRVVGQGPQEYIRNSIVHPSDFVVEGFADVMQKNFGAVLTGSDIDDLIVFLMTLEEQP
jgi:nitric oxide reductase subunit C